MLEPINESAKVADIAMRYVIGDCESLEDFEALESGFELRRKDVNKVGDG